MFVIQSPRSEETGRSPLPSPSRWSWITSVLLLIIGGTIGFIFGRFGPSAFALKYTATWDIATVLSALFTIAVALYVQHAVAASSEAVRHRKSYVAELARRVANEWTSLHALVRQEHPDQESIVSGIRAVNIAVAELRESIAMCRLTVGCSALERRWRDYRLSLESFPWAPLTVSERSEIQRYFEQGRHESNWLVLALPAS